MSIVRLHTAVPVWVPVADVWETPSAYRIDLEVPAVAAEDVSVALEDGVLTVSGERKRAEPGESDRALRRERHHGRFSRRFRLPKDADQGAIEARVEQGVLSLSIAKQAERQPRRIEVVAA